MEIILLEIKSKIPEVNIVVTRKNIKSLHLKVFPDGTVKVSVPLGVSDEWLNKYLNKKAEWIEKSLLRFEKTATNEFEKRIQSGISTRVLGRQVRIIIKKDTIYKVEQVDDFIIIYSPDIDNENALSRQLGCWWQKKSKEYYQSTLDKLFPIVAKHGIEYPSLYVKKMKTLWGSCSIDRNKVNLNYYLLKAPPACIDYVVLHELAHLIYPKHNKEFYNFLTVYMPDWKDRKQILDTEIVLGIEY